MVPGSCDLADHLEQVGHRVRRGAGWSATRCGCTWKLRSEGCRVALSVNVALRAGAGRRTINPLLGTGKGGLRLFGDAIQAIESDLTATVLVLAAGDTKLALIATDVGLVTMPEAARLREGVASALGVPVSHVLLNLSHNHSSPQLPQWMAMTDTPEEARLRERYERDLGRWLVEAALEADAGLRPARIGTGWGESSIGVYRRELRDGRDVLGEVPGHPIDSSVGVMRVDDLDGNPIAVVFRYSAHPVVVGPRSAVTSTDYPGPARDVLERSVGGLALFLQGCGGNINTAVGIGWEVDCRDTKNRVGFELGGEALKVAARIRTDRRAGARKALGNIPNILFTPWEPIGEEAPGVLAALEETVTLEYVELPSLERAHEILAHWQRLREERLAGDAQAWEVRAAQKYEHWAKNLVAAVEDGHPTCELRVQVFRIDDVAIVGMNVEPFFETGLEIRARSVFLDTFVLGYSNGIVSYLPRAEDHPEGGWRLDEAYAVPDLIPQAWNTLPAILHPDSERRAVEHTLELLNRLRG